MTFEEKIYLQILEKLIANDKKLLSRNEYYELIKDIEGSSDKYIYNNLLNNGYIEEGNNFIDETFPKFPDGRMNTVHRVHITNVGKVAYYDLKKRRRNFKIKTVSFWLLFAFSLISAVYSVLSYHFTGKPKSEQLPKSEKSLTPKIEPQPQKQKPDTTKAQIPVSRVPQKQMILPPKK